MKRKFKFCFGIFFLILMLFPGRVVTAALPAVGSYEELISAIRKAKVESRERIEELVEQEKVREAWEIGKLIDAHVLQHKARAEYDKHVVERLAADLGESRTELYFMLQFARTYPMIRPARKLSWSHYQALLSINDSKEREKLAEQVERESWGRDRLREEVRRRKRMRGQANEKEPVAEILTAELGTPGTYKIVKATIGSYQNQPVIDLGFSNYYRPHGKFKFREGEYVTEKNGKPQKVKDVNDRHLFTYQAFVIHVIDGDTFSAVIELGFGFTTVQTLRLRGLDAPEIVSAEGREAKEFLEKTMPQSSDILIRTHRSDKYDRYLADVFVNGEYLNQKLVEQEFAEQVGH